VTRAAGKAGAGTGVRALVAMLALGVVLVVTGCGASRGPVPLRPEPVPYADTLPIPEPRERSPGEVAELLEEAVWEEASEPFSVRDLVNEQHEALNITRFDDAVSSSWWERRIGYRPLTPEEVRRGATTTGPDTSRTLRVVAGKSAGVTPGFTVEDARGTRYVFKFDPPDYLHLVSSADVIASRLFWAAGYHVPEDYKVVFDSARLEVAEDAEITTESGDRPMTDADIREILDRLETTPDGRFVAVASEFVPGVPKGPFLFSGVRGDDPNDHYHHQYRRELRGLYVVSAWMNHFDMRFANTLTSYVEPGYLRHYLIDFAGALGSGSLRPHQPRDGMEHNFDLWAVVGRLATLGFYRAGWEGQDPGVIHPSIGWMRAETFDPDGWKPNWPNQAFRQKTVRDAYWGAKLVAAFSDAHIRAAVEAGGLPDRVAADTLVEILVERRDRTVAHWFGEVTPVEEVRSEPGTGGSDGRGSFTVSFRDLGLEEEVWSPGETRYRWRFRHAARDVELSGEEAAAGRSRQRIGVSLPSPSEVPGDLRGEEALATLRVTALRPGAEGRPAVIHLRWKGPGEGYRVAGLEH